MNARMHPILAQELAPPARADRAVAAIRAIDQVDEQAIADILRVLASKMVASGFSDLDIEAIDDCLGFVCGEQA